MIAPTDEQSPTPGSALGPAPRPEPHGGASEPAQGGKIPHGVVRFVRAHERAAAPRYARAGDAGADLTAVRDATIAPGGGRAAVPTGLVIDVGDGFSAWVLPRSGLALRHGITCLNAPGLVDSGYRGELSVVLVNTDPTEPYVVRAGDRIAQLVVMATPQVHFFEVASLADSPRGSGGFGHTGR